METNVDKMKPVRLFSFLLAVAVGLASAFSAEAAKRSKAEHVIIVGLDGWGAYSVPKADMPNVKALMDAGCFTLKKRTVSPSSSAPNWASMFMGAPVELHGYTKWGSKTPEIPSREVNKNGIFPTVFSIMREQRPEAEIGVLYEGDGIKHLVDTLSLSHHEQAVPDKLHPDTLCKVAEKYIVDKRPQLLAVCFDEPDHTGHAAGHDTPEYYTMLTKLDQFVGRIVEATKKAGIYDNTVIIVTADHGGINKGHGGITLQEMETPFVVAGKGICKGGEIQESMMQYDTASTVADILGLTQPQVWTGRPMKSIYR